MKALITGASSGIGRDIARALAKRGYELILSARREDRLVELARELGAGREHSAPVKIIPQDLAAENGAHQLYDAARGEHIDLLVNNAGFGAFGSFTEIPLEKELDMIRVNVTATHVLTKLFLRDFRARDSGTVLNVASSAAFLPGPLMAAYYASKAYILRLSLAAAEELRREGSHVRISILCPGPVSTEFDQKADVRFSLHSLSSEYVAEYAVRKLLKGKKIIVPGAQMKALRFLEKLASEPMLARSAYGMQKRKRGG